MKPARQQQTNRQRQTKLGQTARLPKKRENGEYRQIRQTATVLQLLANRGPQPALSLARELDLHERTLDRFMRAMARSFPVHLRTVPGSGTAPRWSLDKADFLELFNHKRE